MFVYKLSGCGFKSHCCQVMHLFFQIQSLQLLIFCMDDQEFVTNFISSFLHIKFLLVPYASIELIHCILYTSLAFNTILSTSSVNILCFMPLNHCCDFSISLLFLMNHLWCSFRLSTSSLFFSKWFISFLSWVTSRQFLYLLNLCFHFHFLPLFSHQIHFSLIQLLFYFLPLGNGLSKSFWLQNEIVNFPHLILS